MIDESLAFFYRSSISMECDADAWFCYATNGMFECIGCRMMNVLKGKLGFD